MAFVTLFSGLLTPIFFLFSVFHNRMIVRFIHSFHTLIHNFLCQIKVFGGEPGEYLYIFVDFKVSFGQFSTPVENLCGFSPRCIFLVKKTKILPPLKSPQKSSPCPSFRYGLPHQRRSVAQGRRRVENVQAQSADPLVSRTRRRLPTR